ncbi:MAG TPA: DUF934 domain-containing protein [Bosea sp. (in: a-proteobacteria)]|jgi:uncharacterized protein (DUF934 family)|uniref:DUF934 domain-containing protein n=1 Tax=Bosea sp. (in: a-proteobacteria) TaxID=1871050 RepID=UPI002E140579|nr:DUF934 domain-containing protein [Bosea sp. (in: a-proteobacteria)]
MLLLDRKGAVTNGWTRTEGAAIGNVPKALVAFEVLPEALTQVTPGQEVGVLIPNALSVSELEPYLSRLSLVAIAFPAFADGRGFSLAKAIRRAGFDGTLRASGPLIPDQFDYALACGFDQIELPEASADRQSVQQWQQAIGRLSQTYQRGYRREGNILDRRRLARLASVGALS